MTRDRRLRMIKPQQVQMRWGHFVVMTFDVLLNVTEEGRWSASCPAIPGCETDGATAEEALDNLRESIAL
jgi:hypothetical protein